MELQPITPQPNDRDPNNFVGRVAITERARNHLKNGTNLLLSDPRRMGKTFWLRTFAAQEKSFRCYFIDYEGVDTAEGFLLKTVEQLTKEAKLPSRARKKIGTFFDNVNFEVSFKIVKLKHIFRQIPAHELLKKTLSTLEEDESDLIPLVMMDEVPMAIDSIADKEGTETAKQILHTLRERRQNTRNVRWIITGSIGFHHVLRRIGTTSGVLNDLTSLPLGPMPNNEAEELARRLLLGVNQPENDGVIEELVKHSGGIPFILHKLVGSLAQEYQTIFRPANVRDCFEVFIDNTELFREFEHYNDRIPELYGEQTHIAKRLLTTCLSETNEWIHIERLIKDSSEFTVLDTLIKDHYLEQMGNKVRWRYPTLQYIWARKERQWDRK
jgi:hypothetical protein